MDKGSLIFVSVALIALLSGCLGSGGGGGGEKEPVVNTGTLTLTNRPTGLAQAQPEELTNTVDINLEFANVISIMVNVTIEDGDEGTNPDQIGEIALSEVDGNHTSTIQGGSAPPGEPYFTSIVVDWDGTTYMNTQWQLSMTVSLVAGDDTWIGPFLWVGTPDNGFTYTLEITYLYHEESI